MELTPALKALRNNFAILYPTEVDARPVLATAGVTQQYINFSGKAISMWTRILTYAYNNEQVGEIIQRAIRELDFWTTYRVEWVASGKAPQMVDLICAILASRLRA